MNYEIEAFSYTLYKMLEQLKDKPLRQIFYRYFKKYLFQDFKFNLRFIGQLLKPDAENKRNENNVGMLNSFNKGVNSPFSLLSKGTNTNSLLNIKNKEL